MTQFLQNASRGGRTIGSDECVIRPPPLPSSPRGQDLEAGEIDTCPFVLSLLDAFLGPSAASDV